MTTAQDLLSWALLPENIQACVEELIDKLREADAREAMELLSDIAELTNLRRHMLAPHNAPAHELFRARKQMTSTEEKRS